VLKHLAKHHSILPLKIRPTLNQLGLGYVHKTVNNSQRLNGQERVRAFLSQPPSVWNEDVIFQQMKDAVKQIKVVNNCAEWEISDTKICDLE